MTVQSLDRALRLLEQLDADPCGLVELAHRANLPVSTTSRLLDTLRARGAVDRDAAGTFRIGGFVAALGAHQTTAVTTIETSSAETIAALAAQLDEAACISVPIGTETLTLMQVAVPKPVQAQDWTGHRWSITDGGSGAVMLATWPATRIEPLLASLSSTQRAAVRTEIDKARQSGISWSRGTHVEGLSSVAAPIIGNDGTAVAAVLGYGPSYRFPSKGRAKAVAAAVAEAGRTITQKLAV